MVILHRDKFPNTYLYLDDLLLDSIDLFAGLGFEAPEDPPSLQAELNASSIRGEYIADHQEIWVNLISDTDKQSLAKGHPFLGFSYQIGLTEQLFEDLAYEVQQGLGWGRMNELAKAARQFIGSAIEDGRSFLRDFISAARSGAYSNCQRRVANEYESQAFKGPSSPRIIDHEAFHWFFSNSRIASRLSRSSNSQLAVSTQGSSLHNPPLNPTETQLMILNEAGAWTFDLAIDAKMPIGNSSSNHPELALSTYFQLIKGRAYFGGRPLNLREGDWITAAAHAYAFAYSSAPENIGKALKTASTFNSFIDVLHGR